MAQCLQKIVWIFFILINVIICKPPELKNECDPFAYSDSDKFTSDFILSNSSQDASALKFLLPDYVILCNGGNSAPNLISFRLDSEINGLKSNVDAEIVGSEIRITLPYGRSKFALPSFSTNRSKVFWKGNELTSGESYLDLSSPGELLLKSNNGQTKLYNLVPTLTVPVEDSGQNACYIEGFNTPALAVACNQASFPRQDGDFVDFPNPKGTETSSTRVGYPNDFINLNRISGLVWKTCAEGPTNNTCSGTYSTFTFDVAKSTCDAYNSANGGKGYAGIQGWRLPRLQEVFFMRSYALNGVFAETAKFPNPPANQIRTLDTNLNLATTITTKDSEISQEATNAFREVHCVAGADLPTKLYSDLGGGIILDQRTGLFWTKCALGQSGTNCEIGSPTNYNVSQGMIQCRDLTLGGKSWRLPNISEGVSLFDFTRTSAPFISQTAFPNTSSELTRLSTNLMSNDAYAYELGYSTIGITTSNNKTTGAIGYQVRCVAGP